MDRFIVSLNRCNELSLDNDEVVIENDWETRISIPILTFILLLLRRKNSNIDHRDKIAHTFAQLYPAHLQVTWFIHSFSLIIWTDT